LILKPIKTPLVKTKGDIASFLDNNLKKEKIESGDLIVIASKIVSILEGRLIDLNKIKISETAVALGTEFGVDKKFCSVVLDEADAILGGTKGVITAVKDGIVTPYSGVDRSNVPENFAIPWPKDSSSTAEKIRKYYLEKNNIKIGVIVSDSQVVPLRKGTYGIALGIAGFKGVVEKIGDKDLFGKKLKVTSWNLADALATSANIMMGESDEQCPIVLIKNAPITLNDRDAHELTKELSINRNDCMFKQIIDYSF
jgi:coenzyme F420-0:L-glutamate ligase / coenzyme F420-1:gamma-L-glutamate ligase